jgi:hypothetical protein
MAKTAKQARVVKALPEASAPLTAADVWRFNNSEAVQASNRLVGDTIPDTLENCAFVLAFLSDFHTRNSIGERDKSVAGLNLVVEWVLDAVEKQASELEVDHG